MLRHALIAAACGLLSACQTELPRWATPSEAAPPALSPAICAATEAEPDVPDGAGYPEPVTPEQQRAVARLEAHYAEMTLWGRRGWAIVQIAQKACPADDG